MLFIEQTNWILHASISSSFSVPLTSLNQAFAISSLFYVSPRSFTFEACLLARRRALVALNYARRESDARVTRRRPYIKMPTSANSSVTQTRGKKTGWKVIKGIALRSDEIAQPTIRHSRAPPQLRKSLFLRMAPRAKGILLSSDAFLSSSYSFHSFLANRDSWASIKGSSTSAGYIRRPQAENLGTRLPVFSWLLPPPPNSPRRSCAEKWSSIRDGVEGRRGGKERRKPQKSFSRLSGRWPFKEASLRIRYPFYRVLLFFPLTGGFYVSRHVIVCNIIFRDYYSFFRRI